MYSKQQFELLAPGGDLDSIKAAIAAGADAIYCGLDRFNARNRATNITLDVLDSVLELAHRHDCKIFLTLNIVVLESEIPAIVRLLQQLIDTKIDGVIVQDLGLAYILKHHFPQLDMHASTQMNTHNEGQILLLGNLGASRVNLSRELNIEEITHLAQFGHQHNVLMEVFVHGSYCIGFSGLCYISSARNGASGNRGRCSQPCREQYQRTETGKDFPLNLKDNSAYHDMAALAKAGVHSLKVEGRIKKPHYVYTVVDSWRKQIDTFSQTGELLTDTDSLYTVFNRDFSNGYLQGDINQAMYIDNPRDHAPRHFSQLANAVEPEALQRVKQELYNKKTAIIENVERHTHDMTITQEKRRSLKGAIELSDFTMPEPTREPLTARLVVYISTPEQLELIEQHPEAEFFYQLPDALSDYQAQLTDILAEHSTLVPVFPAILIGEHYQAAKQLVKTLVGRKLVTNNLGVAQLAKELGVNWIAGQQLNITNSFALKCIDSDLAGNGAVISSELSHKQMKRLARPEGFDLYYTLYQPTTLLTSRHCLFMQSVGCKKTRMNRGCLKRCRKHTSILNLRDNPYVIDKQKGCFNSLYADKNALHLDSIEELDGLFTHYVVDLRPIKTETRVLVAESELVSLFEQAVTKLLPTKELSKVILNISNGQYRKGVA
ncbi:peptidase U32 family protein [Vibrio sp. WXL210]|uniref:peptidase U32 family protein n=1 Tax=Vibrio sp. WXL210 TaxID=3450709 RepID=UPI003EC79F39